MGECCVEFITWMIEVREMWSCVWARNFSKEKGKSKPPCQMLSSSSPLWSTKRVGGSRRLLDLCFCWLASGKLWELIMHCEWKWGWTGHWPNVLVLFVLSFLVALSSCVAGHLSLLCMCVCWGGGGGGGREFCLIGCNADYFILFFPFSHFFSPLYFWLMELLLFCSLWFLSFNLLSLKICCSLFVTCFVWRWGLAGEFLCIYYLVFVHTFPALASLFSPLSSFSSLCLVTCSNVQSASYSCVSLLESLLCTVCTL